MAEIPDGTVLEIRGDLDVTTVLTALDYLVSDDGERPDEAARRAGTDLLRRIGWMGSDGRYRLAGPGQVDEGAEQPRKLGGP